MLQKKAGIVLTLQILAEAQGVIGRAQQRRRAAIESHDIRDHA